jgi:hypothetical protein
LNDYLNKFWKMNFLHQNFIFISLLYTILNYKAMKKITLVTLLLLFGVVAIAQTEEKKEVKVTAIERELPENAEKGTEISKMATTTEGGKEKGLSISSAARRNSMVRERNTAGAENSEKGKERATLGAENAERAREIPENAKSRMNAPEGRPAPQNGRPTVVPAARPTAPVVRPNAPVTPNRPVTPTPNRPTPPTRPIPPSGNPGGGL